MNNIRIAGKKDIPAIREIWREVFTGDEVYLSLIFNDLYPLLTAFVYERDKQILSVAFAIPLTVKVMVPDGPEKEDLHGRYLYGVATRSSARGEGLSKKIVEEIKEFCKRRQEKFIVVRPAEESLFDFYFRQEFTQPLYRSKTILEWDTGAVPEAGIRSKRTLYPLSGKSFYRLRETNFTDYFIWSPALLNCILNFIYKEGDLAGTYLFNKTKKYIVAHPDYDNPQPGKNIIIEESSFPESKKHIPKGNAERYHMQETALLLNLAKQLSDEAVQKIILYTPVSNPLKFTLSDFPCLKNCLLQKEKFALLMSLDAKYNTAFEQTFFNFTLE